MTAKVTTAERRAWMATMPWLTPITEQSKPMCAGLKHNKIALKHLYSMGGRPPEGIPDRARCAKRAAWQYAALTGADLAAIHDDEYASEAVLAKSGPYCFAHVWSIMIDYPDEYRRYREWAEAQPDALPTTDDPA